MMLSYIGMMTVVVTTMPASLLRHILYHATGIGTEEIRSCEDLIRSRIAIGAKHSKKRIIDEIVMQGIDERSVLRAMHVLIRQGVLQQEMQGKILKRCAA